MKSANIEVFVPAQSKIIGKWVLVAVTFAALFLGANMHNASESPAATVISNAFKELQTQVAISIMPAEKLQEFQTAVINEKELAVKVSSLEVDLASSQRSTKEYKELLAASTTQSEVLSQKLRAAIIPEPSVKTAIQAQITTPVVNKVVSSTNKVVSIFEEYEFKPELVKSWVSSVF
jgi:hypothetical protein